MISDRPTKAPVLAVRTKCLRWPILPVASAALHLPETWDYHRRSSITSLQIVQLPQHRDACNSHVTVHGWHSRPANDFDFSNATKLDSSQLASLC